MATKIIDLSKPIQHYPKEPFYMRIKIKHKSHKASRWLIRLGLNLPFKLFPKNFFGWADDEIQKLGVHATTHIDAPWHFAPIIEGKPARKIDEIPLEWCYGNGVVINCTHKENFEEITVKDLTNDLAKNNIQLQPGNIVLIRTDKDALMGTAEFATHGTGMSNEATKWLIDQGIKVMGIDQWGWDLPLHYLAKKAKETNNPELFWQSHLVGVNNEYLHMEQLTNLKALPPTGFKVAVFPLKIVGASAAPARVVAIFDEV
jgi:kynurenine formamidase